MLLSFEDLSRGLESVLVKQHFETVRHWKMTKVQQDRFCILIVDILCCSYRPGKSTVLHHLRSVRKTTVFEPVFNAKMINLPRQARDKHGESWKNHRVIRAGLPIHTVQRVRHTRIFLHVRARFETEFALSCPEPVLSLSWQKSSFLHTRFAHFNEETPWLSHLARQDPAVLAHLRARVPHFIDTRAEHPHGATAGAAKTRLCLSAFPVFVPSLSWHNGHF